MNVVTVNGEELDQQLVEQLFHQLKTEAELSSEVSCCERDDEFLAAAVEQAVDRTLLIQEAQRRMKTVPVELLRTELEAVTKLYRENGATWEMLDQQKELFREEAMAGIRMRDYLDTLFKDISEPTNEELQVFLQQHESRYTKPKGVKCLHICKFPDGGESSLAQYDKMLSVRKRVLAGDDFLKIAQAETERHDKQVDLGWTYLERVTSNFEALLFSLRVNEISPVFYEEGAFHLVKVTEIEADQVSDFDSVRDNVLLDYLDERKKSVLDNEAQRLRELASIHKA